MKIENLTPEKLNANPTEIQNFLIEIGFADVEALKNFDVQQHKNKKNAWIIKGEIDKDIKAWYFEYLGKEKAINKWETEAYESKNNYQTTPLNTYKLDAENTAADYQFIYKEICSTWRQLVDVRFKLIGFLPIVSITVMYNLIGSELKDYEKILVCLMGVFFTYGVRIYDLRNTELYNQLVSRGKKIEEELKISNGQFMGRVKSTSHFLINYKLPLNLNKIQHDVGLNIIYRCAFLSWIILIIMILLKD